MTETLRVPGWGVGVGGGVLVAAPGRGTVIYLLWGLDCVRGSSGCSSAGPCEFRACLSLVQLHYHSYYSRHNLMHSDSLHVYNCLVVMEFRLRVGFVGPQRCGSGWFRRCLSLVLRCYDISLGIH